ncbi:KH domain-containing protein [Candidatus Saccharibacteria bacterium]|nr:KH domain-containing protein [Candidatus Saccharibacteria bacterium]
MATIDQQFVEYIVKTLVNNPDKVIVDRQIDEKGVLLSLTVDPEDVGRVIGRRGATAQSIRTLLRALGTKNDARYNLKIVNDEAAPRAEKPEKADKPAEATEGPEAVEGPEAPAEEEPAEVDESAVAEDTFGDEDEASDLAEKTRAELADMDDLDI